MEYRRLGESGLKVSTLCLGTMMFGDRTAEDVAARIVDSALDAGVNFIDTADGYAKGASEAMAGNLITKRREHWVLATKVANAINPKEALIDTLVPPGHTSTPGYTDPKFPILGRVPRT